MSRTVYLNNAAKARFDPSVVATGVACMEKDPWEMNAEEDKERVRELYAQIIDSTTKDTIAIMPSTAFAITLAAQNLKKLAKSGKILLLQDQYPSAVYPFQDLCKTTQGKFSLDIVPYPKKNETWTSLILERLSSADCDISIACLPPLFWCDGSKVDIENIGPLCKEKGIVLIVDATQAAGIYPIHVEKIQPLMMASSVHKWLRGPSGCCLVYMDPTVIEAWQPLDQHDRSRDWHGHSISDRGMLTPTGYPDDFLPGARKFDAGGRTQPILMPMLRTALEKVVLIDTVQAQTQLQSLMQPFRDWAAQSPQIRPLPDSDTCANHIFGLEIKEASPARLQSMLKRLADEFQIIVSIRCGVMRISPYLDNTVEDVNSFVKGLQQVLSQRNNILESPGN
eukprot:scaffold4707_cov164-Amphora_coffeaeformis.AAC.16